jgi:hypothetical protein
VSDRGEAEVSDSTSSVDRRRASTFGKRIGIKIKLECFTHLRTFSGYSLNSTFGRYKGMLIPYRLGGLILPSTGREHGIMFSENGVEV